MTRTSTWRTIGVRSDAQPISFLRPPCRHGVRRDARTSALFEAYEQEGGMLEGVPDILDEGGTDVPVDHAVVERARQVHHVPDHDLVVPDDGALFDLVDAEDGEAEGDRRLVRVQEATAPETQGGLAGEHERGALLLP